MTAGCEADKTFPATFQAGQSYTAQDLNQPSVTRTVFSIATSGSATVPPPIIGTGKGSVEDPLVGSGVSKATLTATLSAKGALTLTNKGKPVTSLPAGRYSFSLLDKDPKAGLTILGPKLEGADQPHGRQVRREEDPRVDARSRTLVVLRRPAELPLHRRHRRARGLALSRASPGRSPGGRLRSGTLAGSCRGRRP